jgi:hypothetical protein
MPGRTVRLNGWGQVSPSSAELVLASDLSRRPGL